MEKLTKQQQFNIDFAKRTGPPPGHKPGTPLPWGWNYEGHLEKPEHLLTEVPLICHKVPAGSRRRSHSSETQYVSTISEKKLNDFLLGKDEETWSRAFLHNATSLVREFVAEVKGLINYAKWNFYASRRRR